MSDPRDSESVPGHEVVETTVEDPNRAIAAEARRILSVSAERSVPARLVGGLAVCLHSSPLHPAFVRPYKDIDLVTPKGRGTEVGQLLGSLGYEGAAEFNALNGHRRLIYGDPRTGRKLDVFVGEFFMCHQLPVTERIDEDPLTVPLAELLLTKLQIVELNQRDVLDAAALLYHHDVSDHDQDAINGARIAELCAADWGLWRTTNQNLERICLLLADVPLGQFEREKIVDRVRILQARIDEEPKPRKWRMRDRIGDRKRWYELPEEVD
jgi:hypothetical protein